MTTHFEQGVNATTGARFWEAVRTVASIATAGALLVIAAESAVFERADERDEPAHTGSVRPPLTAPRPSESWQRLTAVFYLVRTPEQAHLADRGESDRISEASFRQYRILYARDDEEVRLAGQSILDHTLAYRTPPSVHVIDLRDVDVMPQDD